MLTRALVVRESPQITTIVFRPSLGQHKLVFLECDIQACSVNCRHHREGNRHPGRLHCARNDNRGLHHERCTSRVVDFHHRGGPRPEEKENNQPDQPKVDSQNEFQILNNTYVRGGQGSIKSQSYSH